jgi:uncharacterized protein (DUF2336 family)
VSQAINSQVQRLVALAQSHDESSRSDLYLSVAALMERSRTTFSAAEMALLKAIMEQLTRQVEMHVRAALAERLAADDDAPADLILMLANDHIEVAQSVLRTSRLLSEDDLLQIISAASSLHQKVIANRDHLSEKTAIALAENSAPDVLMSLVNNHRARLSGAVMNRLADRSRDVTAIQRSLLNRPEADPDIARRMCAFVSDALHDFITRRFSIDPAEVRRSIEAAATEAHARLTRATTAERLVSKLAAAGQLKSGFAVKALGQGQLEVFEHAVASMIGVPAKVVIDLLSANTALAMALICKAIGIDRAVFNTLYQKAQVMRGHSPIMNENDKTLVERVFQVVSRDDAVHEFLKRAS